VNGCLKWADSRRPIKVAPIFSLEGAVAYEGSRVGVF
jgi:hypothetical protein